jgi:hypothetical protein
MVAFVIPGVNIKNENAKGGGRGEKLCIHNLILNHF